MAIRPEEVTSILERELQKFERKVDVEHVGTVLQVGDTPVKNIGEFCQALVDQGLLIGKRIPVVVVESGDSTSPPPATINLQALK